MKRDETETGVRFKICSVCINFMVFRLDSFRIKLIHDTYMGFSLLTIMYLLYMQCICLRELLPLKYLLILRDWWWSSGKALGFGARGPVFEHMFFTTLIQEKSAKEKERDMTRSNDKSPTPTEHSKRKVTTQNLYQNFDYIKIADQHRAVSSSNDNHQTDMVKSVYGILTFALTIKLCNHGTYI